MKMKMILIPQNIWADNVEMTIKFKMQYNLILLLIYIKQFIANNIMILLFINWIIMERIFIVF